MKNKSGLIVAAAFIGPGTVTTASLAGGQTGMHLAWALIFSVIATVILQDMVVRLSIASKKTLSRNIMSVFAHRYAKQAIALLIFAAIGIGNAAYQSGNLTGAAIGVISATQVESDYWIGLMGFVAALLIFTGSFKWIERALVGLVCAMSLVFIVTLFAIQPDWKTLTQQLTTPSFNLSSLNMILALIGTTLVPYNLFLQASIVSQEASKQTLTSSTSSTRFDSAVAILLGGAVSLVIMATAAIAFYNTNTTVEVANLSAQLTPILGEFAGPFFGLGLLSAGITSSITAPLAAGYAITSIMGWDTRVSSKAFKTVALSIIVIGVFFATIATKPLPLIIFSQTTNALLLPFTIVVLLIVMSKKVTLNQFKNSTVMNGLGIIVFATITLLSGYKIWALF
jgi:NRAMP (natural resistance-associated macrophage protein)-like metal ion transporter